MSGLETDTELVKELCRWAKLPPSTLAKEAGLAATTILRPFNGTAETRLGQISIEKLKARYPGFPGWAVESDTPPTKLVDGGEMVAIQQLDLRLPMGPGFFADDYIDATPVMFDLGYIRQFTRTPACKLRIATGIGDSMYPTLLSSDNVWVDTSRADLSHQDRIYAVSVYGAATIKRLRRIGSGRVLVYGDNPVMRDRDQEVDEADILIGGMIVHFSRDV